MENQKTGESKNIIYALKDPRTDEYRYVGKSIKGIKRAKSHLTFSHNPMVRDWINELRQENYIPDIVILEYVFDWTQLNDKEKYWIGKLSEDEHDLFNVCIVGSYKRTMEAYNKKIIEQIEDRKRILNEKLSKCLLQFGSDADIGNLIKGRREILNISQDHLAAVAEVGVATLKRIELNKGNATIKTLIKILETLGYEIFINLRFRSTTANVSEY